MSATATITNGRLEMGPWYWKSDICDCGRRETTPQQGPNQYPTTGPFPKGRVEVCSFSLRHGFLVVSSNTLSTIRLAMDPQEGFGQRIMNFMRCSLLTLVSPLRQPSPRSV